MDTDATHERERLGSLNTRLESYVVRQAGIADRVAELQAELAHRTASLKALHAAELMQVATERRELEASAARTRAQLEELTSVHGALTGEAARLKAEVASLRGAKSEKASISAELELSQRSLLECRVQLDATLKELNVVKYVLCHLPLILGAVTKK